MKTARIAGFVDVSTNRLSGNYPSGGIEEFGQSIAYLLGAISNILSSDGSRFYRRYYGIGLAEWRLMWVLGIEPQITARRASEIMGLDKAAVSRAVAGLERRGLLRATSDPADNRQRLIALSPAGCELYRKAIVVSRERQRRLLAALADEEQQALAALLRRLHAHLARHDGFDPFDSQSLPPEDDPGAG